MDAPLTPEESALVDRYVTAISEIRETWGPRDAAAAWTTGEAQARASRTAAEFEYIVVRMETAGREAAARRARMYADAAAQAATVGRHRHPYTYLGEIATARRTFPYVPRHRGSYTGR